MYKEDKFIFPFIFWSWVCKFFYKYTVNIKYRIYKFKITKQILFVTVWQLFDNSIFSVKI